RVVLSSTDTVPDPRLPTTTSGRPSPFMSPTATPNDSGPVGIWIAGAKLASPVPASTDTPPLVKSATATSALPSPLRSPAATPAARGRRGPAPPAPAGPPPAATLSVGRSPAGPVPSSTEAESPPLFTVTTSGAPSLLTSATASARVSGPDPNLPAGWRKLPSP